MRNWNQVTTEDENGCGMGKLVDVLMVERYESAAEDEPGSCDRLV